MIQKEKQHNMSESPPQKKAKTGEESNPGKESDLEQEEQTYGSMKRNKFCMSATTPFFPCCVVLMITGHWVKI